MMCPFTRNQTMTLAITLCAGITATLLGACASDVRVDNISRPIKDDEVIRGIPFRVTDRPTATVFMKQPDGSYAKVFRQVVEVPDQGKLYAVRAESGALSDHKLTLEINDDGTLKRVKLTEAQKGTAALAQTGASAGAITTAVATYDQVRAQAEIDALKQQEALRAQREASVTDRAGRVLAFRQALEDAIKAQARIEGLPSTATPTDLAVAEADLRMLQLKANQAARRAGQPVPFPDVDLP